MRYQAIDNLLFRSNRKRFIHRLPENATSILFSNDQQPRNGDQLFKFRQNSDLFYLTGIEQEKTILLISPDCPNQKLRETLFIIKTNEKLATWEGHKYTKKEARNISGIENIFWLDDFEASLREALSFTNTVFLNSNEYVKFFNEIPDKNHRFALDFKDKFPLHKIERAAPILTDLRTIKSAEEIKLIQKACDITQKGFERILKYVKPGVHEFEVEAEIDHEFTINRANGHGYAPIIASGKNACVLHYIDNNEVCTDGDLLLMDFGAEYANYTADMSRTIPVRGKFTERQAACYESVLKVFKELRKLYVPGNSPDLINSTAEKLMEAELIKLGLFTDEDVKNQDKENPLFKKYFMHGVAHPIGLDVHDVGSKYAPFAPGMVFTCEPGLYIREENIGIRLENDILITESDPIDLMENIPIEIAEIEQVMNQSK
ncbi:MAG: X-Pro aminopeptidase [Marinilabiliales bacterium]|nr:MAG: X-Pro aminopeptidase [Marinilabiliales bacterium]